jgi:hypothetical protein
MCVRVSNVVNRKYFTWKENEGLLLTDSVTTEAFAGVPYGDVLWKPVLSYALHEDIIIAF